jgi:molybdenum cofactor cytidylyltransferase
MDEANNSEIKRVGIIVLAAGASRRMKQPKQLLLFEGKTLLRRAVETAVESDYKPVVVVLGAYFEEIKTEIADLPVEIVFNEDWQSGLSSSLNLGIEKLLRAAPEVGALVVTLADQPFVTAEHLNLLGEKFNRTGKPVIAAEYNQTLGVPALFSRIIFDDFKDLSGDKGAKPIIEKHRESLAAVDLPEAAFDIDTPQDFAGLKK